MIQNLLYNFNLFNIAFNNLINTDQTVELLSSYFVTAALTILIVISLVLTFHSKGTAIHKVLGLLLLSIFVVFLWVFQTQFLFIYLVYILAFISAVLMLFLSVVLMLPVSTLSNKNTKINNSIFLVVLPLLTNVDISFITLVLLEFVAFLFILYVWKRYRNDDLRMLWKVILHWLHWDSTVFLNYNKFKEKYSVELLLESEKRGIYVNIYNTIVSLPLLVTYFSWLKKQDVLAAKRQAPIYIIFLDAISSSTLHIISLVLAFIVFFTKKIVYKPIFIISVYTQQLKNGASKMFNKLFDSLVQLYLFINVLAIAFSINFLNSASYKSHKDFSDSVEHVQGLGVLKDMLYDQYGSFLIISTLVLLIALIGAAVMTKNTKSKN